MRNLELSLAVVPSSMLVAGCKKTANDDVVVQTPKGVVTAPDTPHLPAKP